MTARKPLPEIAPCPCGKAKCEVRVPNVAYCRWRVVADCGFAGPLRYSPRVAIVVWNRVNRRSDAEAERRGAMALADWIARECDAEEGAYYRSCVESGEVTGKAAKPEPDVMTQKRCGQGSSCPWAGANGKCNTFRCTRCERTYPWCQGADDDHPNWCDHCAVSETKAKPKPWIVSKPGVMGGKPCVRGTRVTVETLQALAPLYKSNEQILAMYPSVTAEGLAAALAYRLPGKGKRR